MCTNCEVLRAENRKLLKQLGQVADKDRIFTLKRDLGLQPMQAQIVALLFETKRVLSRDDICRMAGVASDNAVSIHMSYIKSALPEGSLEIRNGYRLTLIGRGYLQEILAKERISAASLQTTDVVDAPIGLAILAGRMAHDLGADAAIKALGRISEQLEAHRGHRG